MKIDVKPILSFLTILCISFTFSSLNAQNRFIADSKVKDAFYDLYNFRFSETQAYIQNEKKAHPDNLFPYFLEEYIAFIKATVGQSSTETDAYFDVRDKALDKIEENKFKSPWNRYVLSEIHLHSAFVRLMGAGDISSVFQLLKAGFEVKRGHSLLIENQKMFPSFYPNLKNLGLLHAAIDVVPDQWKGIAKSLTFKGTIWQGTTEIETAWNTSLKENSYSFLQPELLLYKSILSITLLSDKEKTRENLQNFKNIDNAQNLATSPILIYAKARSYTYIGQTDNAIKVLMSKNDSPGVYPFHYLNYMLGLAKLTRLDKDACTWFFIFLQHFKGDSYKKASMQKIAWFYLLDQDEAKYREYMNRIQTIGNDKVDEDKQAIKESQKKELPNLWLLKARLLSDGGYYERALEYLKAAEDHLRTRKDTLELTYRYGRIYHEWGRLTEAIPFYERTLGTGADAPWYFAANAALHLGLVYEKLDKPAKARYFFTKCLSLNPDEYKNGIHQKAKAGLQRVKEQQ